MFFNFYLGKHFQIEVTSQKNLLLDLLVTVALIRISRDFLGTVSERLNRFKGDLGLGNEILDRLCATRAIVRVVADTREGSLDKVIQVREVLASNVCPSSSSDLFSSRADLIFEISTDVLSLTAWTRPAQDPLCCFSLRRICAVSSALSDERNCITPPSR